MAASRAGMASARSLSHSSLMAWAAAAASLATASSAATTCMEEIREHGLLLPPSVQVEVHSVVYSCW